MKRSLGVWFNNVLVGHLIEENNIWSFQYDNSWVDSQIGFDLSPSLLRSDKFILDGSTTRPVQWFFDNLLPEEQARDLIAKDQKFESSDSFSMLAHFGYESAGALTLLAEGETVAEQGEIPLSESELSERIKKLPRTPLASTAAKRMSLAGAQHKLPLIYRNGALFEPTGNTVSSHILKPDHQDTDDYPHSVANEWFVMQLAKRVGLDVPETYYRQVPEPIYLIERFDRVASEEGTLLRRHTMDGCQLLSIYGKDKYAGSTIDNLNKIIDLCRTKATAKQRLFKWMLFNTVIGNADAHLKNLSVFCEPEGMTVTPHYDLLSTTSYAEIGQWGEDELSWQLGGATYFKEVRSSHFINFGEQINLKRPFINRTISYLLKKIETESASLLKQTEEMTGDEKMSPGELRHLRTIVFGVIKDMLNQLG
ncbi:HipA domain-containing protein [Alkalimarinus coralli]|uniref:HipA domain-containing protein n=1 Tax=Alkalimarinus coralli TaxID=2935863 RepID=UPI00202AC9AA|nr:HipA domain-containing protein [Alkalimarinus coralli]